MIEEMNRQEKNLCDQQQNTSFFPERKGNSSSVRNDVSIYTAGASRYYCDGTMHTAAVAQQHTKKRRGLEKKSRLSL